jgi:beta-lactamase class A
VSSLEAIFAGAGCRGWLCVREIDGDGVVSLDADELVASASVFKIAVGLEVLRQVEAGILDRHARIRLFADDRTPGPTGFSMFDDDVEASVIDLTRMMLAISDNAATDALIDHIGLSHINENLRSLRLRHTTVQGPLRELLRSIADDAGFADWSQLTKDAARSTDGIPDIDDRIARAQSLQPARCFPTTPTETASLLSLIWRDQAAPPGACAQLRAMMATQLTRHRLASAFTREASVAAKSGSLGGVIRNEAGVIEMPDGRRYAAAVFTRAAAPWINENKINAAIGRAAAHAIEQLQSGSALDAREGGL